MRVPLGFVTMRAVRMGRGVATSIGRPLWAGFPGIARAITRLTPRRVTAHVASFMATLNLRAGLRTRTERAHVAPLARQLRARLVLERTRVVAALTVVVAPWTVVLAPHALLIAPRRLATRRLAHALTIAPGLAHGRLRPWSTTARCELSRSR